jgi:hypothetical protein
MTKKHFSLEIPEFEGFYLTDDIYIFRIYGIESEKPIVRINQFLFEGKWIFLQFMPIILSERYLGNNDDELQKKSKKQCKISKLCLNDEKKVLRLYRIPLLIKIK